MKRIPEDRFRTDVELILRRSIGTDYIGGIIEHEVGTGLTVIELVREDVEEASGWNDEDYYNDDDIKLAIGRVLSELLGI